MARRQGLRQGLRPGRYSTNPNAANMVIEMIRQRQDAPQLEEDRQHEVRQRTIKGAMDMLSLGADKMQVARELGRAGIVLPEREVTTRALAHPLGAGEDPEAAAFIPRVESTSREVDLSVLESPRDTFTRNLQQTDEAAVQRENVRRRDFPTTDELWSATLKKIKDGVRLTPEDNQFVTDAVKLRSGDPGAKRHFEDEIFGSLRTGGVESLNPQQREYYNTNIRGRDLEAQQRDDARRDEELRLRKEGIGVTREGQAENRAARDDARADAQRNRVFTGLDNERARVATKYERRRANVLPGHTEQDQLAKIDSEEAFEQAQIVGRWKKRYPALASDIETQYGTDVGPGRGPRGSGFLDSFGDPTQPPRGPR